MARQISGPNVLPTTPKPVDPSTSFIVLDAEDPKWASAKAAGHQVVGQLMNVRTSQGLAADGVGQCHREYEDTKTGPAIILGMGPSRKNLPKNPKYPIYAINRAAEECKPAIWCAHDIDAVLDSHEKVPLDVPLATYSCNWLKAGFDRVVASGRKLIFWDIFPEPLRHGRRPLYWNVTTLGPVLDWVVRMGHSPVYTLGTDLSTVGYGNRHYPERDMEIEHEYVRLKMCFMFRKDEIPKWNVKQTPIYDLSHGNAPWERRGLNEIA